MREWEGVEGTYWSWAVILLELPPIVSTMEVCEGVRRGYSDGGNYRRKRAAQQRLKLSKCVVLKNQECDTKQRMRLLGCVRSEGKTSLAIAYRRRSSLGYRGVGSWQRDGSSWR